MSSVGIVGDWVEVPQFLCAPSWLVGFLVEVSPNWVVGWWFGVVPNLVVGYGFWVAPNWVVVCQVGVGHN